MTADHRRGGQEYCIEWQSETDGPCVCCEGVTGTGPVGWHKTEPVGPVCDECMIRECRSLGAVLMTVNVIREISPTPGEGRADHDRKVVGLLTFATCYNMSESKTWPFRRIGFLEALEETTDNTGPRADR